MEKFRKYLFTILKDVDIDDKEEMLVTLQWLAKELIQYYYVISQYENKLKELMITKEFEEFSLNISKELFQQQVDMLDDGEFKNFCQQNIEKIIEEVEEENQ